jgi:hypothetical protein
MREVLLAFGTDIIGIAYQLSIGPKIDFHNYFDAKYNGECTGID